LSLFNGVFFMVTKAAKPAASKTTAAKAPVSKKVVAAKKAAPAPAKTPAE
jgi:hypothetical protein